MQYVFIVTYGRSGSTVLSNVLNAIPDYCIRGENGGAFNHLVRAHRAIIEGQKVTKKSAQPSSPWYGIEQVRPDRFAEALVRVFHDEVLIPPPGTRVTGCKDIRYTPEHLDDEAFAFVIDFILTRFDARIIFNTRSPEEVARSGWWTKRSDAVSLIEASNIRFRAVRHPSTFLIDHAQYNGNPEGLRPMLQWLGEDIPADVLSSVASQRLNHMKTLRQFFR